MENWPLVSSYLDRKNSKILFSQNMTGERGKCLDLEKLFLIIVQPLLFDSVDYDVVFFVVSIFEQIFRCLCLLFDWVVNFDSFFSQRKSEFLRIYEPE